jgi:hypothetical protein
VVLAEALAAARAIQHEGYRAWALAALAPHLAEQERVRLLAEVLAAARSTWHEGERSEALAALAPHLPAELLAEALAAARAIQHEGYRAWALAALAPHLAEQDRPVVLAEALTAARAARTVEYEGTCSSVLAALAPHLPAELLAKALTAARATQHVVYRSLALAALAPHLAEQDRPVVLAEALADACSIGAGQGELVLAGDLFLPEWDPPSPVGTHVPEGARCETLAAIAQRLTGLSWVALSCLWLETLPLLAARTRRSLLADLHSLVPVLVALAGPHTPTELREIARAITDVARWWP